MAQVLDDNSVMPSFMSVRPRGFAEDPGNLTNLALRIGEVKDIIYPDSDLNQNKRFIEYVVEVQHRDGIGPGTTSEYMGCMVSNLFGGAADVLRYTLRKDDGASVGEDGLGVGSKVLLLCINGTGTRAIILGGVRDTRVDARSVETHADGHNFFTEFNGLSVGIDRAGQFKLQFRGATKVDGSLDTAEGAAEANGPTTVEIQKNGNFRVYTKDQKQLLHIDHENRRAEFSFDTAWNVKVGGDVTEDYGGSWTSTVGSTISTSAEKDISIESKAGTWTMQSAGRSFIKSAGLQVGAATDAMYKGSTHRRAEAVKHTQLMTSLSALSVQLGIAGAAISVACQPMKIPVIGPVIASGILQPAGVALTASVAIVAQMVSTLANHEGQAMTYLSLVNNND